MGIKDIIEILISLLISVLVIGYSFFETKSIKYYENNIHNGEWKENSQRIEKTRTEGERFLNAEECNKLSVHLIKKHFGGTIVQAGEKK